MDDETLAKARQQMERALGLARLATDPDLKQQWLALADGWSQLISAIERTAPARDDEDSDAESGGAGPPGRRA